MKVAGGAYGEQEGEGVREGETLCDEAGVGEEGEGVSEGVERRRLRKGESVLQVRVGRGYRRTKKMTTVTEL